MNVKDVNPKGGLNMFTLKDINATEEKILETINQYYADKLCDVSRAVLASHISSSVRLKFNREKLAKCARSYNGNNIKGSYEIADAIITAELEIIEVEP